MAEEVPGGDTGLLVKEVFYSSNGTRERYEVDTALLKEIRATEEQAARELGQWIDRARVDLVKTEEWVEIKALIITVLHPYPEAAKALLQRLAAKDPKALTDENFSG